MGEDNTYTILVGEPEEKIPLPSARPRWAYNTDADVTVLEWDDVN